MERTVNAPLKRNFIRGDSGAVAVKTEVSAYPVSSYNGFRSMGKPAGSDASQLLKTLADVSPALGEYLNYKNDEQNKIDEGVGASDMMGGKSPVDDPTVGYLKGYYSLKARKDAADAQVDAANSFLNKADTMTPDEWTAAKQQWAAKYLDSSVNPYHREALIPLLADAEGMMDAEYVKIQREQAQTESMNNFSVGLNSILDKFGPDDIEGMGAAINQLRDNAALTGISTKESSAILKAAIQNKAIGTGNRKWTEVLKVPYKGLSPYQAGDREDIDQIGRQADAAWWEMESHKRTIFNDEQNKWQNLRLNQYEVRIVRNRSNPGGLNQIAQEIMRDMVTPTKEGFILDNGSAKVYLNSIISVQKGENTEGIKTDLGKYTEARYNILYGGTITNYADLMPYRPYLKSSDFEQLLGYIDKANNRGEKGDTAAVERAAVESVNRQRFDSFVKNKTGWWAKVRKKPEKVIYDYDQLISTLPTAQIPKATDTLIKALNDSDADEMMEAINQTYDQLKQRTPPKVDPKRGTIPQGQGLGGQAKAPAHPTKITQVPGVPSKEIPAITATLLAKGLAVSEANIKLMYTNALNANKKNGGKKK